MLGLWSLYAGPTHKPYPSVDFNTLLENGMTAGALAHLPADTSFNTTNINLVGLAQTGIEFLPS